MIIVVNFFEPSIMYSISNKFVNNLFSQRNNFQQNSLFSAQKFSYDVVTFSETSLEKKKIGSLLDALNIDTLPDKTEAFYKDAALALMLPL